MSPTDASYGLENIILHHSFKEVKGRTIRISCGQRTHVGGKNGAGKTSILQLIPAFYGEEPERIVTKASGRASFLDYYLPNLQSLIIFEYRRHSGLCCAVLYRHPQGKLCYRFVEGSVDETFFRPEVRALLKNGATNDVLFSELKTVGVNVSSMIDTITDYRAVIQRNQKLLKRQPAEAKRLRALSNDFSMGSPDTRMSHIDRLTHVVLNKNRLLSSFKLMLCETMFTHMHLNERPRVLDDRDLVNDILSVKAFEQEESKIRDCLKQDAERKSIAERAGRSTARLRSTAEEQRDRQVELTKESDKLKEDFALEKEDFQRSDDRIGQRIADADHELETRTTDLNQLYDQERDFEQLGLPEKERELTNLPEYRGQLRDAEADHSALTGKVSDLDTEHERLLLHVQRTFGDEQVRRKEKVTTANHAMTRAAHEHEQNLSKLDNERDTEVGNYREERHKKRPLLDEERVRLETIRDNPGQTPEEAEQIQEAEGKVTELDGQHNKMDGDLGDATRKREQARQDRDAAQDHLSNAEKSADTLDDEFDALQRQLAPDSNTWLAKLREDDPRWSAALAKVVNPDLLMRTDLEPMLAEPASDTLMGWALDLESVFTPGFAASEDQLRARLNAKDEQRLQARRACTESEQAARKRNDTLHERQREVDWIEREKGILENYLTTARNQLKNTRLALKDAQEQRRVAMNLEVTAIRGRLGEFDADTVANLRGIKDRYAGQAMELRSQWAGKKAERQDEIDNAEKIADDAERDFNDRLERLKKAHADRLKEAGVDPVEVRSAREKMESLQKRIQGIEQSESDIQDYRSWRKRDWSRVHDLQTQCAEREKNLDILRRQRKDASDTYHEKSDKLNKSIKALADRLNKTNRELEAADAILRKCEALDNGSDEIPGNLATLTEELQEALGQLERLRGQVIKAYRSAVSVLRRYENTMIHKAWQELQQYQISQLADPNDQYDDAFELSQVENLRHLLDRDLPNLRYTLIDQFTAAAGAMGDYFGSLQNMISEVKQVSNTLRTKINTDQQIDSLSDIQVVLKPRIYEDESWQPLKNFVERWQDWRLSHRRDIPTDHLIREFQMVVTTLRSARLGNNIESLVDLELKLVENGNPRTIRNDNDFLNASSTGLTYLAIMAVFMGMTRYLCPDINTRITWPIDELGTLSANNISRLASMMQHNNLSMISACPKLDHGLRKFFENKVSLKEGRVHIFDHSETGTDPERKKQFADIARSRAPSDEVNHAQ